MSNAIIKCSKHPLNDLNKGKGTLLYEFITEYQKVLSYCVDYIWHNEITYFIGDTKHTINIAKDQLNIPSFLSSKDIQFKSNLSERAVKCVLTQACSIVKSATRYRQKLLFVIDKLQKEGKLNKYILDKFVKCKISKPDCSKLYPELNSICCNLEDSELKYFDNVVVLHSLGTHYGKIIIPIHHNKQSKKLLRRGKILKSFQIHPNFIGIRYDIDCKEHKMEGKVVGADQGIVTCMTLSDQQVTIKDPHGHDLRSIIQKICRKRKGSKAIKRAQHHRTNYINWAIKRLDLTNIKEIRLEKISNFRKGKRVGNFLNAFNESLIRDRMMELAKIQGVLVKEQSSPYRSQRCNECGYVCKGNRIGKKFKCLKCSHAIDADLNGAINHEIDLPDSRLFLHHFRQRIRTFYWREEGFFDEDGQEIAVPDTYKRL